MATADVETGMHDGSNGTAITGLYDVPGEDPA